MKKFREPVRSNPFKTKKFIISTLTLTCVIAVAACIYFVLYPAMTTSARETRIKAIFKSLNLDKKNYTVQSESIFGETRPYEWDRSRTQSSYRTYTHAADVKTTVTEVKKAIEDAGFTYFNEPYPGSLQIQYHFKSQRNEYIRMTVSSKPRDDAFQNKSKMNLSPTDEDFAIDGNAGPSNIIIKVNLDDNNE